MWAAVNKLDDEMAAGSYDGKGCSIEQAWNCMLDFAPDAPALAATPSPAPAQEVATLSLAAEDVHAAFAKNFPKSRISQAWINFAADIAQAIAARAAALKNEMEEVGLTDEEIDTIASKYMSTVGDHWCNEEAIRERHAEDFARAIIAALRAKGGK